MTTPTTTTEYDSSLFQSPEYNARLEAKTKFMLYELEGNNLSIRSGKLTNNPENKTDEVKVKKFANHEEAITELTKEYKAKQKSYSIKSDTGSKKLSELEIPASTKGKKGSKKKETEDKGEKNAEDTSKPEEEEVGEKRKSASEGKETSTESDAKKQKVSESSSTPAAAVAASTHPDTKSGEQMSLMTDVAKSASEEKKLDPATTGV